MKAKNRVRNAIKKIATALRDINEAKVLDDNKERIEMIDRARLMMLEAAAPQSYPYAMLTIL